MNTSMITYHDAVGLCGGRFGITDTPCPICGPDCSRAFNTKRKVLRIWHDEPGFATFSCARCSAHGYARDDHAKTISSKRMKQLQREASQRELEHKQRQAEKAEWLYAHKQPCDDTIVETYLRTARGYNGPIPATAGYLPATDRHPHPAMILPFGVAEEPEPGTLYMHDEMLRGIHLTLLKPDGSGKADVKPDKIMVGPSNGWPIVIAPMNDTLVLYICEGIETGLSLHEATGCGVWAAGSAGRLPGLADKIPDYYDGVTIAGETDGRDGARELAKRLISRGLHCELLFLDEEEEAA